MNCAWVPTIFPAILSNEKATTLENSNLIADSYYENIRAYSWVKVIIFKTSEKVYLYIDCC